MADTTNIDLISDLDLLYKYEKPYGELRRAESLNDADNIKFLKIEAELPDLFRRVLGRLAELLKYHLADLALKAATNRNGREQRIIKLLVADLKMAYTWVRFAKMKSLTAKDYGKCFIAVDAVVNTYHSNRGFMIWPPELKDLRRFWWWCQKTGRQFDRNPVYAREQAVDLGLLLSY